MGHTCCSQWRIQDFPQGAPTPEGDANILFDQFLPKTTWNEEILARGAPPRSANGSKSVVTSEVIFWEGLNLSWGPQQLINFGYFFDWLTSGGFKGALILVVFMHFSRKIDQNIRLAPPSLRLAPPSSKSWIHHYLLSPYDKKMTHPKQNTSSVLLHEKSVKWNNLSWTILLNKDSLKH